MKCVILESYIGEEERIRHDALFFSQNPEDGLLLSGKSCFKFKACTGLSISIDFII